MKLKFTLTTIAATAIAYEDLYATLVKAIAPIQNIRQGVQDGESISQ
jgi:hypothetical protein